MSSTTVYQRGADGYPVRADTIMRDGYGPIPDTTEFQHGGWGYEIPLEIHGWSWSPDFGRWSALVTFNDGWHGFTYPKTWSDPDSDPTDRPTRETEEHDMKVHEQDHEGAVDFTLNDYDQYVRYLDTLLAERGATDRVDTKQIDAKTGEVHHAVLYTSPSRGPVYVNGRGYSSAPEPTDHPATETAAPFTCCHVGCDQESMGNGLCAEHHYAHASAPVDFSDIPCAACHGTGADDDNAPTYLCPVCVGTGLRAAAPADGTTFTRDDGSTGVWVNGLPRTTVEVPMA